MKMAMRSLTTYVIDAADEGVDRRLRRGPRRYSLLLAGHSIATSTDPFGTRLSEIDHQRLHRAAGVVVVEELRQATKVEIYDSLPELQDRWNSLREAS